MAALPVVQPLRASLFPPEAQRAALHRLPLAREFDDALNEADVHPLRSAQITTLQVNVGKLCNQTCRHCHVDAGPDRTEVMSRETMALCLRVLDGSSIDTVDITGGAPELNPNFRWFVRECRALGKRVIDRCNLTIIETKPYADLPSFFAEHDVEVVCSLPHFRATSTDRQRGSGVYSKSIAALRKLNAVGYGKGAAKRRLVLVTNPVGAFLPAAQASVEAEWKRELARTEGVSFDALYTITNMPISRYLEWLIDSENLEPYMQRLLSAFNPLAAHRVMCRNLVSVGWDGTLYDCDFNQMLELTLEPSAPQHIRDFDLRRLERRSIRVDRHCFGCTAGSGSSCGGATAG